MTISPGPTADTWTPPHDLGLPLLTDRLVLRPYEHADAAELHMLVQTDREHLVPWMPWARSEHRTLDATRLRIAEWRHAMASPDTLGSVVLGIFHRRMKLLLGGTGFHNLDRAAGSVEFGYFLRRQALGQGLATEAARAVISWILGAAESGGLGLRRACMWCAGCNERSRRLADRIGLPLERIERAGLHVEGIGITDRIGWGITADEWDASAHRPRPGTPTCRLAPA